MLLGAWLFRHRREGPMLAFGMYGNPTMWSLPIAAAALGPRAAVVLAAYDMLTSRGSRSACGCCAAGADPAARTTALTDYAPMAGAVAGVVLGRFVEAPAALPDVVTIAGTVLAASSAVLLGVAWPGGRWLKRPELGLAAKALALHLTFVPGVLLAARCWAGDPAGAVGAGARAVPDGDAVVLAPVRVLGRARRRRGLALSTWRRWRCCRWRWPLAG